jgi:hypothetical protein
MFAGGAIELVGVFEDPEGAPFGDSELRSQALHAVAVRRMREDRPRLVSSAFAITVFWQTAMCRNLLATPYSDLLPSPTDYPNPCARLRLCPKCGIGTMVQLQALFRCYGPVPLLVNTS